MLHLYSISLTSFTSVISLTLILLAFLMTHSSFLTLSSSLTAQPVCVGPATGHKLQLYSLLSACCLSRYEWAAGEGWIFIAALSLRAKQNNWGSVLNIRTCVCGKQDLFLSFAVDWVAAKFTHPAHLKALKSAVSSFCFKFIQICSRRDAQSVSSPTAKTLPCWMFQLNTFFLC